MALPLLIGAASFFGSKSAQKKTPAARREQTAAELEATRNVEGRKQTARAGLALNQRGASGFGANPNTAKPFLLSL